MEQPGSQLRALVLQLYGAGNLPSAKRDLIETLERASARGILVVATTQCLSGSVNLGMYAVGQGLAKVRGRLFMTRRNVGWCGPLCLLLFFIFVLSKKFVTPFFWSVYLSTDKTSKLAQP